MALELHVWGPALGLDSIDPECLAAIAYFQYAVPHQHWALIASNDVAVSPDCVLPALNHRGTWTSGYINIVAYLAQHTDYYIDHDLTPLQRADSLACASYLMTRGSGLLALLLYVIPSTWTEITRPAYSSLLRFPMTWTVPPAIRAAAIEKADHLGLGYLAAEVEAQDAAGEGPATTTSTGFLRLREALGPSRAMKPEQAGAIRLHHLTEDFYSNLDQLRDDKRYCLRDDRPSALDFLVFGYLQLMRAQPHHPSLKPELEDRVEDLLARVDTLRQKQALPWREPSPKSLANTLGRFADGALGHTPVAGNSWRRWRIGGIRNAGEEEEEAKNATHMILAAGGAVLGLAAVGAALLFRGLAPLGAPTHRFEPTRKEEGSRLNQFGEIGAILDGLPVWGPSQG